MNRVLRVFGTCDDWQVEFVNKGDNLWSCSVPADMTDGQYACRFYALDEDGDIGFWCGVLYLSSGQVCLKLDNDPIFFSLVSEDLDFEVVCCDNIAFEVVSADFEFTLQPETLNITIERECCHG